MAKGRKNDLPAQDLSQAVKRETVSFPIATGTISIELETPDGVIERGVYGVKPGIPKILVKGQPVFTASLMKLANDQVLTEKEEADSPLLGKWDSAAAKEFIHSEVSRKAGWLQKLN